MIRSEKGECAIARMSWVRAGDSPPSSPGGRVVTALTLSQLGLDIAALVYLNLEL
jgi:hypothetical protein